MCIYLYLKLSSSSYPIPTSLNTSKRRSCHEIISHTGGLGPLETCLKGSDGGIWIKRREVTSSLPHQGAAQGDPLPALSPEGGHFGISKFYSVISLQLAWPPVVWNSKTAGCVINVIPEKSQLCRAQVPAIASGSSGARPAHMEQNGQETVPRPPRPVPLPGPAPAGCIRNAAEAYLCPVVALIAVKRAHWKHCSRKEGHLHQDFTGRTVSIFRSNSLSHWKSFSLAHSLSAA